MAEGYQRIMIKTHDYTPSSTQVQYTAVLVTPGAILLVLAGLAAVAMVALAPVLILLSLVLIPLGALLFVTVAGLFYAGCFALGAFFGVSWFYNYLNGRHPPGSDQVDYACMRIADTASHVNYRAREYGGYLQSNRRDAAPGA